MIMENAQVNQSSRIPSLDGLRALAILLVIEGHLHDRLPEWLSWLPGYGATGVQLFFVISGFIITHNLLKEKNRSGTVNLVSFWSRRFFRIYPAFFAFMIFIGFVYYNYDIYFDKRSYILTFFLLSSVIPLSGGWYIGHTWSLSVEQFFYIIWPPLLNLGLGFRFLIVSIILWPFFRALHYLICDKYHLFYLPINDLVNNYIFMSSGCLLAFLINKYNYSNLCYLKWHFLFALCLTYPILEKIIFDNFLLDYKPAQTYISSFSAVPISLCFLYSVLFLISIKNTIFYKFFNSAPMVYIGSISYSLYLFQQFFTIPLKWHNFEIQQIPMNILLMLVFTLLLYYLVEAPCIRLGHKLFAKPKSAQ